MANDTRGVFRLRTLRRENVEGDGVPLDDVWVSPSYGVPFAYASGGTDPASGTYTIVQKIEFSSDSVARAPSADIGTPTRNAYNQGPLSNSTAAYYVSGRGIHPNGVQAYYTNTYKTTYATDTSASITKFPFPNVPSPGSYGWDFLGTTATETTGYIGGGNRSPATVATQLYKLDFSTDGYSELPSFPQYQMYTGDALGNQTHGYWSGGTQVPAGTSPGAPTGYGAHTIIARFTYSTDTHSNVGTLPAPRKQVAASGNATEGYIYGGVDGHPAPANEWTSTAIKLTYSTDTTSLNPSNLAQYPRISDTRGSGNLSDGYVTAAGGAGSPGPGTSTNIFKFDYSTGTQSTPGSLKSTYVARGFANASSRSYGHPGKLSTERWKDGASETMNKGHFASDTNNKSLYSLEMNTDSAAIMPAAVNNYVSWQSQGFSNLTNGWWAGGSNPGGTSIDQIVKTPYATDTPNPSVASMVERRRGPMIAGNMTHARIAGGFSHDNPGDRRSNFEKFTYSTESAALLPSVNLPQKDSQGGGSGNQELGYYTGGEYSYSWYFKVTYSTDTGAQVPSANQSPVNGPSSRSFASTLANFRAGASTDSVQKVPFADDTFSLLPSISPANLGSQSGGAAANRTHGYYTHAGWSSYMYKMSFATETAEQLTTYPAENGFGNSLQGQSNGPITTTPTATPTPSIARQDHTYGIYRTSTRSDFQKRDFTTGSTSVIPSINSPGVAGSLVSDEVAIYSNDWNTAGKSVKMPWGSGTGASSPNTWSTSINPYFVGGEGPAPNMSSTKGYFTGGKNPSISPSPANGVSNRRQHIVFASGTGVSEGGKAQDYIWQAGSSDTATKGYMYGGFTAAWGGQNTISSMDFATDGSFSSVPGATLSYSRADMAVVGNKETAYIAGTTYGQPGIPAQVSRFEKFTYATETNQSIPGLDTPYASNRSMSATGDQEKGYWAGSSDNPNSIVVTYSTETKSGTPNYPHVTSNSSPDAISQAQNAGSPGQIIVPISVL